MYIEKTYLGLTLRAACICLNVVEVENRETCLDKAIFQIWKNELFSQP